jgi:hypothetical protein
MSARSLQTGRFPDLHLEHEAQKPTTGTVSLSPELRTDGRTDIADALCKEKKF